MRGISKKRMKAAVAVLVSSAAVVLLAILVSEFHSATTADLVVKNAKIYTMDVDDSLQLADWIAVRNGRVLRVGTGRNAAEKMVGPTTTVVDASGHILLPGFIDSHVHLIFAGLQMMRLDLRGIDSKQQFLTSLEQAAANAKRGSWILGGGWNNDLWGGELPLASWIDDITPHNPVLLSRMDGHMSLVNSVALELAGITKLSDSPNGGTIVKTTSGEPSGLLIDSARELILPLIPKVTIEERREALRIASNHALMRGVTTVVDLGRYFHVESVQDSWEDFSDVYQWADLLGKMRIRACLFFPLETWSRLRDLVSNVGKSWSQWIYLGGVKAFADGSLGSRSALFYEPYADDPHNHGLHVGDYETLHNLILASDRAKLQIAIHAIGDRANDLILNLYESVISTNGARDRRFRIEHAQHLAPGAPAKFGKLGIVASVQPEHLLFDAESVYKKLGINRAQKGSYLFQSLLNSNAELVFGSDWPVVDINPLGGIITAMKRIPPGWDTAWGSAESVSLNDSLKAYTLSAARACFLERELGSLSPGKLADFVVLSINSWHDFVEGSASINATYVGGVQAYP